MIPNLHTRADDVVSLTACLRPLPPSLPRNWKIEEVRLIARSLEADLFISLSLSLGDRDAAEGKGASYGAAETASSSNRKKIYNVHTPMLPRSG